LRAQIAQIDQENKTLSEQQKLQNELKRLNGFGKTKLYNGTKMAIVIIIVFLVVIGTMGSMHFGPFSAFSMDDFVKFLGSFSPIFITLTSSIGLGGIAKNVVKVISDKNGSGTTTEGAGDDPTGEELAKSGGST